MIRKRRVQYGYHYDVRVSGGSWNKGKQDLHVRTFTKIEEAKWCNEWLKRSVEWDKQILREREMDANIS